MCNGQLLAISQNQALFSLLGTIYGGDGKTNFALPNLQGRVPMQIGAGAGSSIFLGEQGGEESHTLTLPEMAAHTHNVNGSADEAADKSPAGETWAAASVSAYHPAPNVQMSPAGIGNTGGSQPHGNMQPYLALKYCIAMEGIFPSRDETNDNTSDCFIGEIRLFAGNFAPEGWAFCDGQLVSILQNTALFSLLGTTYGGDGKSTFALPDLRGRAPIHAGQGPGLSLRKLGEQGGEAAVSLQVDEMPPHTHEVRYGASSRPVGDPAGGLWTETAGRRTGKAYGPMANPVPMSPQALSVSGQSQPHNNMQPYLGVNFIIALTGTFPLRNG